MADCRLCAGQNRSPVELANGVLMIRKRYVGPILHLRGKTAFVQPRRDDAGQVMAQFEELYLREARGWWQFAAADFE